MNRKPYQTFYNAEMAKRAIDALRAAGYPVNVETTGKRIEIWID